LYHYTTQEGLLAIIKTRQLWASKIQYLNDITEFRHGLMLIQRALHERSPSTVDSLTGSYLQQIGDRLPRLADLNVFVVSFSEVGDLLSQWRAYGGAGVGYALGLESNRVANLAFHQGFALAACIYDLSEQEKKAKEFVAHQLEYFASVRPKFANESVDNAQQWIVNLTSEFCQHAVALAPLFKDAAFGEERSGDSSHSPKAFATKAMVFVRGAISWFHTVLLLWKKTANSVSMK
jgi:hypothetical protein